MVKHSIKSNSKSKPTHQFICNFPKRLSSLNSISEWAKINHKTLYDALNKKDKEKIKKDQEKRAQALVKYMAQNSLSNIVLLDSVGRIISQIISEFENAGMLQNINSITVVENNKKTHEYHVRELPYSITKIHGNVIDHTFDNNVTFVYLNFCSIREIVNDIGGSDAFICYLKTIKHLMIGYTDEGTKKGTSVTGIKRKKTELSKVLKFITSEYAFVSKRGFYKTYISRS
jgi:hypothetical protein